jgi:hypothetical protein
MIRLNIQINDSVVNRNDCINEQIMSFCEQFVYSSHSNHYICIGIETNGKFYFCH